MTETGSGVVYDGRPLDGVEVRLADDGEIQLRGPMLLRAYRDGTDPKDADGWLATGDLGAWTPTAASRPRPARRPHRSPAARTSGPTPVEPALAQHPGVAEVVVAGRPDPEWGQRVVAFVVPVTDGRRRTSTGSAAWVKERLPAFCAPRELVLVERLPRTALGKPPHVRRRCTDRPASTGLDRRDHGRDRASRAVDRRTARQTVVADARAAVDDEVSPVIHDARSLARNSGQRWRCPPARRGGAAAGWRPASSP